MGITLPDSSLLQCSLRYRWKQILAMNIAPKSGDALKLYWTQVWVVATQLRFSQFSVIASEPSAALDDHLVSNMFTVEEKSLDASGEIWLQMMRSNL